MSVWQMARRGEPRPTTTCKFNGLDLLALVLIMALFQSISAQASSELPQVFKLDCLWEHAGNVDESDPAPQRQDGIAFSSSSAPKKVGYGEEVRLVEIRGVAGTRHFVVPDFGSVLAGLSVTVFADGTSVHTQIYRFDSKIAVNASVGTCEVFE